MRWLLLFVTICAQLFSVEILNEKEPNFLHNLPVNPITGRFDYQKTDVIMDGVEPILITRRCVDVSYDNFIRWEIFEHLKFQYSEDRKNKTIQFCLPLVQGGSVVCVVDNGFCSIDSSKYLNTFAPEIGGKYHPQNIRMCLTKKHLTVNYGDGTVRLYEKRDGYFVLIEEETCRGYFICYSYDKHNRVRTIETKSHDKSISFATARITYTGKRY